MNTLHVHVFAIWKLSIYIPLIIIKCSNTNFFKIQEDLLIFHAKKELWKKNV